MKVAKFITINVGLHVDGSKEPVHTPGHAKCILRDYGLDCAYSRVEVAHHDKGTEYTLIVMVPYVGEMENFKAAIWFASDVLQQDCIAYAYESNGQLIGKLVGPNAEAWGEFNPEYFLPYDDAIDLAA